jgi:rhodanese-related sulfurtransferase
MRRKALIFTFTLMVGLSLAAIVTLAATDVAIAQGGSIYQATLAEPNQKTQEVSTEDVRRILVEGSAIVLDTRKRSEYVAGHIPGARNVDAPPSEYVAGVERLVSGNKSKALVLYCNGPFCQASRRLSEQLVAAGFTNVRRYQLGIPIWRALGGPTEIELEGILRIFKVDQTTVFFDARTAEEFSKGSLSGAHNVPADKLASDGLSKAPLPTDDFNTRIVLFGRDSGQARTLADALSKSPFHNVVYFPGPFDTLRTAIK